MAFCLKCGTDIGEANICPKCGTYVQGQQQSAAPVQQPVQGQQNFYMNGGAGQSQQYSNSRMNCIPQPASKGPDKSGLIFLIISGLIILASIIVYSIAGGTKNPAIGKWIGTYMSIQGQSYPLSAMDDAEFTIEIKSNGSCLVCMSGEDDTEGKWTYKDGTLTLTGMGALNNEETGDGDNEDTMSGKIDGDTLTLENIAGTEDYNIEFAREGSDSLKEALEEAATYTEPSYDYSESSTYDDYAEEESSDYSESTSYEDDCEKYNGDWKGIFEISDATGAYSEAISYAVMRVAMNDDNTGEVYLCPWLSGDGYDADIKAEPEFDEYGDLILKDSTLHERSLGDMYFYQDYSGNVGDAAYSACAYYSDDIGSYTITFYFVPWSEKWPDEATGDYAFTSDDQELFDNNSLEEVVGDKFGYDTSSIPDEAE